VLNLFFNGFILGLSIAAPVGPIGVMCIQRTLTEGRGSGLCSGLGAATGDAIYGCMAGFGLTSITNLLIDYQVLLRLVGGGFLCALGLKSFITQPPELETSVKVSGHIREYISTFLLTITNPVTILSFLAVFAGWGVGRARVTDTNYLSAILLVLGVFTGSGFWWVILSSGVNMFRAQFNYQKLRWVNRISGCLIILLGAITLVALISS
jgi:threonine/homoserine/homoserine lactone efflux protein